MLRSILPVAVVLLSLASPVLAGWDGYASLGTWAKRSTRDLSDPSLSLIISKVDVAYANGDLEYLERGSELKVSDFHRDAPEEFTLAAEDGSYFEAVTEVDSRTPIRGQLDVDVGGYWHYPESFGLDAVYAEVTVRFQSNGGHWLQIKLQSENLLTGE
jgi:hypothetical protein